MEFCMDIDFTKNIIPIVGSCFAILYSILQIFKLYSESRKNTKGALIEDYKNTKLILEDTSEDDIIYNKIKSGHIT